MSRGIVLACALVAAAAAATFSMRACAERRRRSAIEWESGTTTPCSAARRRPASRRARSKSAEVFWYGCGHCYALDPTLETWKKKKAAYIEFVRVPVIWGPPHVQHARLYYTLQALGRGDLHPKVFDAIHRDGVMLAADSDEQARALQLAFLKQHGVTSSSSTPPMTPSKS